MVKLMKSKICNNCNLKKSCGVEIYQKGKIVFCPFKKTNEDNIEFRKNKKKSYNKIQ